MSYPNPSATAKTPIIKLSGETVPVGIDFSDLLASGETLTGTPTASISPPGPTASSVAVTASAFTSVAGNTIATGKGISLLLAGGQPGNRHTLTITCGTTTTGRVVGGKVIVIVDP